MPPNVPVLMPADASPDARDVYDEFHRRMEFPAPPNFILTQGHSPTTARGTCEAVRHVLVTGEVPRWIKEMMFVAISRDRGGRYCEAAHIACCRKLGVTPALLEALVCDLFSIDDSKLRDMLLFAVKCARNPQNLVQADFESLRRLGLQHSEIVEIIGTSALAVYANIIADATAMEPDEVLSGR